VVPKAHAGGDHDQNESEETKDARHHTERTGGFHGCVKVIRKILRVVSYIPPFTVPLSVGVVVDAVRLNSPQTNASIGNVTGSTDLEEAAAEGSDKCEDHGTKGEKAREGQKRVGATHTAKKRM
jgi:hypothetical protein